MSVKQSTGVYFDDEMLEEIKGSMEEGDDLAGEEAHEAFSDEDSNVSADDFESDEDEDESEEESEEEDQEYSPEM